jgi:catechol 2,3-dioxygenase-like lactoylglutathione lyase family enzyme
MQWASHSAVGLPSISTSASWMLAFLMPADVRRSFKLPPEFVGVGENALVAYGSVRGRDWQRTKNSAAIFAILDNGRVALRRMDNVGIVVESLDAAISFFTELGLELEGRAMIEGDWSGRVTGLRDQRVEIAMMRMPDGHGGIELSRFLTPPPIADHRNAPVNALGYLRVMFAVDDLDDTLARLREHGAQLVDEVVDYNDVSRLCYVRGPEGILIGLAEQIG